MAREDWPRYVFASIADYLKGVADDLTPTVESLVEGQDERTDVFMRATDRAEIRITGPVIQELSHGYYRLDVTASVLLTGRYDGAGKNSSRILKYAGAFADAMQGPIAVYKYGDEAGDYNEADPATQVSLGCLSLMPGRGVRVSHYGQLDTVDRLKQSEVEARFVMELSE